MLLALHEFLSVLVINALTPVAPMSYFLFDFDKLKQFLLVSHPFISHTAWRDLDGIK